MAPASSPAVTVTLGPPDLSAPPVTYSECPKCQSFGSLNTVAPAGVSLTAPTDGAITGWSVIGEAVGGATLHLIVFKPHSDGSFTGGALSAAGAFDGTRNSTSQPIAAGETVGISLNKLVTNKESDPDHVAAAVAQGAAWSEIGAYAEGQTQSPLTSVLNRQLLYNATVQLFAPALTSVAPNTGGAGTTVTITGQHLAVATGVTFGGVPATSFSGNDEQITAVAPPRIGGGAVDVQVTTAGGTSLGLPLDLFLYADTALPLMADHTPPTISSLSLSPASFKAANVGASVIARHVTSRVSYRLSEPATTTFTAQRVLPGRRSGKRCGAPSRSNRGRRRCTRLKAVPGSFTHTGKLGPNSFTFTGRIAGTALARGSYRLTGTAKDAAGNRSKAAARAFSIVR